MIRFVAALLFVADVALATLGPVNGRTYLLYNEYAGDNPYEYLAWTLDPSIAMNADSNDPGLFMAQGAAGVSPPQSGWIFEVQTDGTYRIYSTDNSYPGVPKRLDVHSDGVTPFLGDIGSTNVGQVWQLSALSDGISFNLYNQGWSKAMDINGGGGSGFLNAPFMNSDVEASLKGQAWQIGDITPTSLFTDTNVVTQTQTITPDPTTVYVGGGQTQVTTTTVVYSTLILTVTATPPPAALKQRDDTTIPVPITVTSTVSTTYVTTTSVTTLPAPTSLVTNPGGTNTVTVTSISSITTTITSTISLTNSVSSPQSTGSQGTTVIKISGSSVTVTQIQTQVPASGSSTASASSSPQGQSITGLAAGLGAGLAFLFALLLCLGFFLWWRHKNRKPPPGQESQDVVTQFSHGNPHNGQIGLPSESGVVSSMATTDGASSQEYPSPVAAELEKNSPANEGRGNGLPGQSELYGELHATATPLDLMAPDINISGYSYEGRYELPTS